MLDKYIKKYVDENYQNLSDDDIDNLTIDNIKTLETEEYKVYKKVITVIDKIEAKQYLKNYKKDVWIDDVKNELVGGYRQALQSKYPDVDFDFRKNGDKRIVEIHLDGIEQTEITEI